MKEHTNFANTVESSQVLETAISLVKTAKQQILVTKCAGVQSTVTPDDRYFTVLQQKIAEGIDVHRVFFGTQQECELDKSNNPQVIYHYGGPQEAYQRMIMIDQHVAMFLLGETFCMTSYLPLVSSLLQYCEDCASTTLKL